MFDKNKYTPKQVETLRKNYVDNECYSDEYRETQPAKGIGRYLYALDLLHNDIFDIEPTEDQKREIIGLMTAATTWIQECGPRYAGNDELAIVLGKVFDILWERGTHPYYDTDTEIDESLEDW